MKKKSKKRKNKSKKKLIITLIVVSIFIIITLLVTFKIFIINWYDVEKLETTAYDKFLNTYEHKETLITKNIPVENNDYLTYKNIKIKNNYKDYQKEELKNSGQSVVYKKLDASGNTVDALQISITEESYIDMFAAQDKTFYTSIDSEGNDTPIASDVSDYLKDNSVDSDFELFDLLSKTRNFKPTIFTSVNKIKSNYGVHSIASIILPETEKFIVLSGDYTGYIQFFGTEKVTKQATIFKDGYTYYFLFTNNKPDNEILEIINSLVIEKVVNH